MNQNPIMPSHERVWMKHYPPFARDAKMPESSMYAALKEVCLRRSHKTAVFYYGTKVSYGMLLEKIDEAANAFYDLGVRPGEIVSFLTVTTPETIYAMYGLNKLGAICNFIDPRMDLERIYSGIAGTKSRFLVTLDLPYPKVHALRSRLSLQKTVVISAEDSLPWYAKAAQRIQNPKKPSVPYGAAVLRWADLIRRGKHTAAKEVPYQKDTACIITYTGGTTGTPKGVLLTNDGMNAVAESFRICGVDARGGDRFLDIMPVFASYGVVCGLHMPFIMEQEIIVIPKFVPDELGGMIRKYCPNHMMGVPSFYERIMHSRALWDVDLSFLKTTGCGGDTMNPGLEDRFNRFMREHHAPYKLSQGYGMSEVTGSATCCFSNVYKDGSAGIPLPAVTIGIFDPETDEELGYDREGEICLTGPTVMQGYYDDPNETANILRTHADGRKWIHSGDIGHIDPDGFLYISGRIKHMIVKFDGHKVFPIQIETLVNRHKAVGTCAVISIPDRDHAQGQVPLVVVELKHTLPEPVERERIRKEILDLCNTTLEERGRPADLVFAEEMPRTSMGKINVRSLQEQFIDYDYR